mmetsp:Transcript_77869/g.202903  ORF Transcript_77869/g.202903 Transcript_77869/m.202903 type:complete len:219 (-) Transcript_77869:219-875(-)
MTTSPKPPGRGRCWPLEFLEGFTMVCWISTRETSPYSEKCLRRTSLLWRPSRLICWTTMMQSDASCISTFWHWSTRSRSGCRTSLGAPAGAAASPNPQKSVTEVGSSLEPRKTGQSGAAATLGASVEAAAGAAELAVERACGSCCGASRGAWASFGAGRVETSSPGADATSAGHVFTRCSSFCWHSSSREWSLCSAHCVRAAVCTTRSSGSASRSSSR